MVGSLVFFDPTKTYTHETAISFTAIPLFFLEEVGIGSFNVR